MPGTWHDPPVFPNDRSDEAAEQDPKVFATTHWSVVIRAKKSDSPEAQVAMEHLCRTYWYPLYVFVRRKGHNHEDACDLTQGFFERFLEKDYLRSVNSNLGKFRTFLLTSLSHFIANEWDKKRAQRRGGHYQLLSIDAASAEERFAMEPVDHASPEAIFERRWAEALIAEVLGRLAVETDPARFDTLKTFLLEDKGVISYEAAARQLRMSPAAVASAIFRIRGRFRILLSEEIAKTVGNPEDIDPELRHLLAALGD